MKKINWRWDYSVYVPFCPYCDELAYEQDKCVFCGKPYKWVEPKYKPKEIQVEGYTVVQSTNNHIQIYDETDKMVFHASCNKKLTEQELAEQVKFYKNMCKKTSKIKSQD